MKKKKRPGVEAAITDRADLRELILRSAIAILTTMGRESLTARSISEAVGIQTPTLYRIFGDMRGLLDAIAEYGFVNAFNKKKAHRQSLDPIEDLRALWDLHIVFGLENPVIYSLMRGDPASGHCSARPTAGGSTSESTSQTNRASRKTKDARATSCKLDSRRLIWDRVIAARYGGGQT